jgi:hypothetical protein
VATALGNKTKYASELPAASGNKTLCASELPLLAAGSSEAHYVLLPRAVAAGSSGQAK